MRSDTRKRNNAISRTEKIQACRVCLVMDRKLYEMTDKNNLLQSYVQLTGIEMDESLPHHICWECGHRLQSCIDFRKKAVQGHKIMMNILQNKLCLTAQNLNSVDRIKNGLSSNLSIKRIDVNHNDLHVHDTMPPNYDINSEENEILNDLQKTDPINENELINFDIKNKNDEVDENVFNGDIKQLYMDNIDPIKETGFEIKHERDEIETRDENERLYYTNNDVTIDFDTDNTSSSDMVVSIRKTKKDKKRRLIGNSRKKTKLTKIKVDKRRKPASEVLSEDLFTISDLSLQEQLAEIVNRQYSANYKNAVFKCTVCYKGFVDEEAYNGHMIRHTEQSGKYECEICKIRFKQPHAKRNHTASHQQRFSCKCCPYVSTRRNAAKLHEQWHNGTRYQCPHCEEDFDKFSTYMGHIRIKHPSDIVCDQCGYTFVSEKGLRLHRKLKHRFDEQEVPSEGPLCEQCNVRFVSQEAHENHLKMSPKHNDLSGRKRTRKARDPQETSKGIKDKTKEEKKKRTSYKPDEPIPCEQCAMELPDSLSYYRHFRRAHPGMNRTNYPSMKSKSMCEVCGKMFQSLALLQDHSWTHTDSKQFKCPQCDKTFQRKYRLIAHRRLHRGPRASYVCGVCGKHFTTASNRQRHMFIHTGLKPFKCEMCGKCFKHASEKRAHITYVHLKKPWPKRARGKRQDTKQIQLPQAMPSASEIDIVQPLWP